ncbi:MAG TPA: AsmA family protein [Albitalea sp.]
MSEASRNRWRKAWPLAVLAGVVLAVGVCEWQGWPFLKGPVQSRLTQQLHRQVEFGDSFRLKLFGSIRLDTDALRVGAPGDLPDGSPLAGDLVNARDAHLELPYGTLMGLWRGRDEETPRITSLRFGAVDAALKRQADGRANWTLVAPHPDTPKKAFELPLVDELVVERGRLVYDDALTKTALEAQVSTSEGEAVEQGQRRGLRVEGRGRREGQPFEFRVASSGVLPLVARDAVVAVPLTIRANSGDSRFSFDGQGTDVLSFHALDGDAALSGPSLAKVGDALGLTLPTTEPFKLKGRLSKSGQRWALKQAALDVGDSQLGGEFSYDRAPKVPMLSGQLVGSRLVLADLLPAFGAARPGSGNPKPPAGHVVPQREFDIPSLHRMNADVKVRLQRAELGTLFRRPLAPLQGDLRLDGGVLKLSNLVARTSGGEIKGALGLDATNARQPLWTADVRWAGIELDEWLRPRNPSSQSGKPRGEQPGYVTGKLGGHAKLQAHGRSTAKMIGSTDGTVQAWVRDGTISHLVVEAAGLDLAQGLGLMIVGDDPLPMYCAAVKANARNGVLTPEVAIVDTRDSTLFASGTVSLGDERMDLKLTSRPKDMSPATLRSPVHVSGTFSQPQFKLEKQPMAARLLGAAVLAAVHPLAALIPLFDPGDKESAGGCQRALQRLRDADGPAGARDARAPRSTDKNLPPEREPRRQAEAPEPAPVRK